MQVSTTMQSFGKARELRASARRANSSPTATSLSSSRQAKSPPSTAAAAAATRPPLPLSSPRRPLPRPPRASFLDELLQKASSPKKGASSAASSIVDELLELTAGTDAGAADRTTTDQRQRIAQLASSLKRYRMRNPARSPLLWGSYEVSYCSNPNAAGGPVLRSGPGRAFAKSQRPTQQLVESADGKEGSSKIRNKVEFSAFGVLPTTSASQEGPLTVTGGDSYRVVLEKATRDFEILYLDDRVRVVEFVPSDGRDRQLFVFKRIGAGGGEGGEDGEEEAAAEEEEEGVPPARPSRRGAVPSSSAPAPPASSPSPSPSPRPASLFGDLGSFFAKPAESLATVVERESGGAIETTTKAKAAAAKNKAPSRRQVQQQQPRQNHQQQQQQPRQKQQPQAAAAASAREEKAPVAPPALFGGLLGNILGGEDDENDSAETDDLLASLKRELAAAAAELKEAESEEKRIVRAGAPTLRSTAKERAELQRAREEFERVAERASKAAEVAAERAEELSKALARAKELARK